MTIDEGVAYSGRARNVRLANDAVELILPTEIGPRVLRYAPREGQNAFGEVSPEEQGNATPFGDRWHIYGGHRLWYAPEGDPRSYYPDNAPVRVEVLGSRVRLTQAFEEHTRLEKAIEVELDPEGSHVRVAHRLTNHGAFDVELSPWALTVMAKGGRAIFPHAPFVPHPQALAPARPLVLWPFTRMSDPRWTWGDRLIFLRQDPRLEAAQKIGFYDREGWMAYAVHGMVFVKRFRPMSGPHADFGCNVETFTNDAILELETLGPLTRLAPGASATHEEHWFLFPDVRIDESDGEGAVMAALAPLVAATDEAVARAAAHTAS